MGELVRAFFAALPDERTRERIASLSEALDLDKGSRRTPLENLHMTVAFVGELAPEQIALLRELGAKQRAQQFVLRLDTYEYWAVPKIVVALASELPAALQALRAGLRDGLARSGLALDPKPFRPHLTLAKKVLQAPELQAMSEVAWRVRGFQLMRSVQAARGSVYTVLDTWPLLDESAEHR
ncbi:MAG TPA: RNA 2',3'-cyclic phosphodiesterase [Steroidobacteraceae bacterium]|nr:RNA 2',3'-cyclic phosphodiesterase [Steroidobacteraceae bacterium]